MSFWENVDEELKFKGLTRTYLAQKAGFSLTNIGKGIQLGSTPSADTAVKIAKVLGVSVEYLVTGKLAESSDETLSQEFHLFQKYRQFIRKMDSLPSNARECMEFFVSKLGNNAD